MKHEYPVCDAKTYSYLMDHRIDISVIIPVYNAATLLPRCLNSILAQKGGYEYEVLLIDDGSTDDSVEIIESYKNPHFKVFRQENAGPSKARNKGLLEAIAMLSDGSAVT